MRASLSYSSLPSSYAHYKSKYGQTPEGFLAYVQEQIGALRKCEARGDYTPRECALYFEALGNDEERLFFHADQVSVCRDLPWLPVTVLLDLAGQFKCWLAHDCMIDLLCRSS